MYVVRQDPVQALHICMADLACSLLHALTCMENFLSFRVRSVVTRNSFKAVTAMQNNAS